MAQETTKNARNNPAMTAHKSVEKLLSNTDPADNNFVSSFVDDNYINNIRRSEKRMLKKHRNNLSKLQKDY